jgi:flavin-binding protein dodecin
VDSVYKKIEVVGTSTTSVTDAINTAVAKASGTIKNIGWFEVIESRGRIQDGAVTQFQVTLKIGFKLED